MKEISNKTEAQKQIKSLIDRFTENISQYKRTDYDEANTRVDFIDPFFEALGWDVANKQAYAEQYREVVREAKVIIVGKHKAPDYSFRIGGIRKFFVEAKKPSVDLKKEVSPAFQLRRYAYTAKLPLSILTDFEELSVYDTRILIFFLIHFPKMQSLKVVLTVMWKPQRIKEALPRLTRNS